MGDYNMFPMVTMLALGTVIVLCVLWKRQSTDLDSLGAVSQVWLAEERAASHIGRLR
jgi:hypothetical protein